MPTDAPLVVAGNVVGLERSWTPAELGLSAVNLKANPSSGVSSVIPLQGFSHFMLTIVVNNTGGGSTGKYKLTINQYDEQGVTILSAFDLFADGNLKADNTVTFVWGVQGAKVNGTATITADSADDIVQFGARSTFTIANTEVLDSTHTVAVSCYLRART